MNGEWAKCTLNDLEKEMGGLLMFCRAGPANSTESVPYDLKWIDCIRIG